MKRQLIIAALIAGSVGFTPVVRAQENSAVSVTAHISLEKEVITLGEPVIVRFTFNNASGKGVVVNLGYGDEKLKVKVIDPGGRSLQKPPPARQGFGFADAFTAEAGSTRAGQSLSTTGLCLTRWERTKLRSPYRRFHLRRSLSNTA